MKKSETIKEVDQTKDFAIHWPKELEIEPLFKVAVTPTRTALVYPDERKNVASYDDKRNPIYEVTKGYRVIYILNRTGAAPRTDRTGYGHQSGAYYEKLLDLKLAIEQYSAANMPSKKTSTRTTEFDDE